MKATVVIGANYGDEGKGLMTDFFVSRKKADAVVRFNGGAQAGHTVVTPDDKRHVFSHFASGSFLNAKTVLSRYFIVNPIFFQKEHQTLSKLVEPAVLVDCRCQVTTPWDIIWNIVLERSRGVARHGSCGAGINETIRRSDILPLTVGDLSYILTSAVICADIKNYYIQKVKDSQIDISGYERFFDQTDNTVLTQFIEDIRFFLNKVSIFQEMPIFERVVFEGAQGLALDEFYGDFPHVTRSRTGLHNVVCLQRELGFNIEEVCYVTRSYLTRHGAGPFREVAGLSYKDNTNKPNPHQGTLRFGVLNYKEALERIRLDVKSVNYRGVSTIAMTHLDQCGFADSNGEINYYSFGPTRADIYQSNLSMGEKQNGR